MGPVAVGAGSWMTVGPIASDTVNRSSTLATGLSIVTGWLNWTPVP